MALKISGANRTRSQIETLIQKYDRQQRYKERHFLLVDGVPFDESITTAFLQLLRRRKRWHKITLHKCRTSQESFGEIILVAALHHTDALECRDLQFHHFTPRTTELDIGQLLLLDHQQSLQQQQQPKVIYYPLLMELTCARHLISLSLSSSNCICDVATAQALYNGLSTNYSITCLELQENCGANNSNAIKNSNQEAITILAQALAETNVLEILKLQFTGAVNGHQLDNKYWQQLLLPLRHHKTLQSLYVYGIETYTDLMHPLGTLLLNQMPSLTFIKVGGFVRDNFEYFVQCLGANHTLLGLQLGTTSLTDTELLSLSQALRKNEKLQRLDTDAAHTLHELFFISEQDNHIETGENNNNNNNNNNNDNNTTKSSSDFTDLGMQAIVSAMQQNVTINKLILPNFFRSGFREYQCQVDFYSNLNKAGRCLVLRDTNKCPISLWPLVLARINSIDKFLISGKAVEHKKAPSSFQKRDVIATTIYSLKRQEKASILYWLLREGTVLLSSKISKEE